MIERISNLPHDLDREVGPAAAQEGFRPIELLQREWALGTNRFGKPGEALYAARSQGRLVGVCGLNRDPYSDDEATGRLRRLYILPAFRRRGVGSSLVGHALQHAEEHFAVVRLRTLDPGSAQFFEALGFRPADGQEAVTHEMLLG